MQPADMSADLHTVEIHLQAINEYLNADYNELCINQPGELYAYKAGQWTAIDSPALDYAWCEEFARLIANYSSQQVEPIMSAELPGGQRVEVNLPPVTPCPVITIRIPPRGAAFTFQQIIDFGTLDNVQWVQSKGLSEQQRQSLEQELPAKDRELLELFKARDYAAFLPKCVVYKKNMFFSGQTGSGKTALANALSAMIPLDERIVTVEDTRETRLPHKNQVNLLFSRNPKAHDKQRAKSVLASTLRQFPSRVLLSELRGDEAYFFFQNVINSGHPGTLASFHANSSRLAFRRVANMIQASPEGSQLSREVILEDLHMLIDVVVQTDINDKGRPYVREIYFDPAYAIKNIG